MLQRFSSFLLLLALLLSPLQTVFAEEGLGASETELYIPVYFFADEHGGVLGIAPLSDEIVVWAYAIFDNVGTTTTAHNVLQSLAYTYDTVGNITQIKDLSGFGGDKTVLYAYDDLYRLTSASTTAASRGNYNQTFAYSSIGNITSAPLGSYTYGETGYTNPHGATQIGNRALTYDNNGNVTDFGNDDYTWNYRDRLTKSIVGEVTTLYGYDFNNDRVTKGNGTATTTYANRYFNQKGATTTKHIYDNAGLLLATIEGNGTATSTNYIHTDHLGGTSIVTDEDGDVVESVDYYPYGSQRINTGTFTEQRKFTGHEFDTESDLTYAKARYYDQDSAKFLSIDPVVSNLTMDKRRDAVLNDPQLANSYSYARNNPLVLVDQSGEFVDVPWISNNSWVQQSATAAYDQGGAWQFAMDHPYITSAGVGVGSGVVAYGGAAGLTSLSIQSVGGLGTTCLAFCGTAGQEASRYANTLNNVASSPSVKNLVNSVYKPTDTIRGGTFGAIRNEVVTGTLTKGIDHLTKASQTLNRVGNIINKGNLTKGDIGVMQTILSNAGKELGKATEQLSKLAK